MELEPVFSAAADTLRAIPRSELLMTTTSREAATTTVKPEPSWKREAEAEEASRGSNITRTATLWRSTQFAAFRELEKNPKN